MSGVEIKLADLCEVITKGTTPSNIGAEFTDDGIKYIRSEMLTSSKYITEDGFLYISEDTHNKLKRSQLKAGDILFSMAGVYLGKTAILRECDVPSNTNQAVALIRVIPEKCNREFVYYYLNLPEVVKSVNSITGQAAQPNINLKQIGNIPILLPSREIQDQIVFLVSAYDDLIEKNQKQIKLLEEAAQRLYKEWFVDLRFPGHETTPITNGIPEGWKNVVVTDLLEIKYGKDHKALEDGNIPVYGSGGVMRKVNKILHSGESVLIPRKGSLNNILLVSGDFWTIDTMFFSIPRKPYVAKYVYLFLSGVDMYAMNIGAAVPSMTVKILDGMKVLCPSTEMLAQFERVVGPYFSMIELLKKKNESLAEARDLLLPKLMNGEIEV